MAWTFRHFAPGSLAPPGTKKKTANQYIFFYLLLIYFFFIIISKHCGCRCSCHLAIFFFFTFLSYGNTPFISLSHTYTHFILYKHSCSLFFISALCQTRSQGQHNYLFLRLSFVLVYGSQRGWAGTALQGVSCSYDKQQDGTPRQASNDPISPNPGKRLIYVGVQLFLTFGRQENVQV